MADERQSRRDALLRAARERLTDEEPLPAAEPPNRTEADTGGLGAGREVMYRGKKVRRGNAGTPGSGLNRNPRSARGGGPSNSDVRAALEKLNNLYRDGLISKAEAEAKRAQILDRL